MTVKEALERLLPIADRIAPANIASARALVMLADGINEILSAVEREEARASEQHN